MPQDEPSLPPGGATTLPDRERVRVELGTAPAEPTGLEDLSLDFARGRFGVAGRAVITPGALAEAEAKAQKVAELVRPVEPKTFAEQKRARREAATGIGGFWDNLIDGLDETISGIGHLVTAQWRAAYTLFTDPAEFRDFFVSGRAWSMAKSMVTGYWEELQQQYKGFNLVHSLYYYPWETLQDLGTVLWGVGTMLKLSAKAAGATRIAEAMAKFSAVPTPGEMRVLKLHALGEKVQAIPGIPMRAAWTGFRKAWHASDALHYLQTIYGLGPTSEAGAIARRSMAHAARRAAMRAQFLADDLALRGVEIPRTDAAKQAAMEAVLKGEKALDQLTAAERAYVAQQERYFRAYALGEGMSELSDAERAYVKEMQRQSWAIRDEMVAIEDIPPEHAIARELDPVIKYRKDAGELRKYLAQEFGLPEEHMAKSGFIGLENHPRFSEAIVGLSKKLGDDMPGHIHIPHDDAAALLDNIFAWNKRGGPRTTLLRERGSLPESVANAMPTNFHDFMLRGMMARYSLLENTKAIAELVDPDGAFAKFARPIKDINELKPGESLLPGGTLLANLGATREALGVMVDVMGSAIKLGRKMNEGAWKHALAESIKKMYAASPARLMQQQANTLSKLAVQLYAVPDDAAWYIARSLYPAQSVLGSWVEKFNGMFKMSVLALNPAWYLQAIVGGAAQSFLATGSVIPLGRHPYLRATRKMAGIPVEFQGRLKGYIDQQVASIVPEHPFWKIARATFDPGGIKQRLASLQNYIDDMFRGATAEHAIAAEIKRLLKEGNERVAAPLAEALQHMRVVESGPARLPVVIDVPTEVKAAGFASAEEALAAVRAGGEQAKKISPELAQALLDQGRVPLVFEYQADVLRRAYEQRRIDLVRYQHAQATLNRLKQEAELVRSAPEAEQKAVVGRERVPAPPEAVAAAKASAEALESEKVRVRGEYTRAALELRELAGKAVPGAVAPDAVRLVDIGGGKVVALPGNALGVAQLFLSNPRLAALYEKLRRRFATTLVGTRRPPRKQVALEEIRGGAGASELSTEELERRIQEAERRMQGFSPETPETVRVAEEGLEGEALEELLESEAEAERALGGIGAQKARSQVQRELFAEAPEPRLAPAKIETVPVPDLSGRFMDIIERGLKSGRRISVRDIKGAFVEAMLTPEARELLHRPTFRGWKETRGGFKRPTGEIVHRKTGDAPRLPIPSHRFESEFVDVSGLRGPVRQAGEFVKPRIFASIRGPGGRLIRLEIRIVNGEIQYLLPEKAQGSRVISNPKFARGGRYEAQEGEIEFWEDLDGRPGARISRDDAESVIMEKQYEAEFFKRESRFRIPPETPEEIMAKLRAQEAMTEKIADVITRPSFNRDLNALLTASEKNPGLLAELKKFSEAHAGARRGSPGRTEAFLAKSEEVRRLKKRMVELEGAKAAAAHDVERVITKLELAERAVEEQSIRLRELGRALSDNHPYAQALDNVYRTVDDFHFQYFNLHPFHRAFIRNTLFPFWSWYINIARLIFTTPFTHPQRVKLISDMARMSLEAAADPSQPEWMWDYVPVGHYIDGAGQREVLLMNVKNWDPRASFPTDEAGIVTRLHPFAMMVVQSVDGKDVVTRAPLRPGVIINPADGRMYEFSVADGRVREVSAFNPANLPQAATNLLLMHPAAYFVHVLTKPYTKTETQALVSEEASAKLFGIPTGIHPVHAARLMQAIFRLKLSTREALQKREMIERSLRDMVLREARQAIRELNGRFYHTLGRERAMQSLMRLVEDINKTTRR